MNCKGKLSNLSFPLSLPDCSPEKENQSHKNLFHSSCPSRLKLNKIKYLKMLNFVFASMKRKSFSFFKVVSKENELKTLFCFLFICLKKIYKPYNSIYFPPTFHFIICLCIAMCRRMKNGWKTLRLVFKFSSFFSIEMMTLERGKNIV